MESEPIAKTFREIAEAACRNDGWLKLVYKKIEKAAKAGNFSVKIDCSEMLYRDSPPNREGFKTFEMKELVEAGFGIRGDYRFSNNPFATREDSKVFYLIISW